MTNFCTKIVVSKQACVIYVRFEIASFILLSNPEKKNFHKVCDLPIHERLYLAGMVKKNGNIGRKFQQEEGYLRPSEYGTYSDDEF